MRSIFAKYYYEDIESFLNKTIPKDASFFKMGKKLPKGKYDYIILPNTLAFENDIQKFLENLKAISHNKTRVIFIYYNFLWRPLLELATVFNLRKKIKKEPNWLNTQDIKNFFLLAGFEHIKGGRRFIFPISLGFFSKFINTYLAQLPLINHFCLTTYQVFAVSQLKNEYSVSIIIPARNEAGNIKGVLKKIPYLGKATEVIFVEGNSKDNTYEAIIKEVEDYKGPLKASYFKQKGKGKGDAVRLGFSKANNQILMILDADLTVSPIDLEKFYSALAKGHTEFANGSRLVYPMEKQAMRLLNYFGNKIFSILFTYLLGQRIKDTLCGTKVLFKSDYELIAKNRKVFGDFDPFGDFDLLFGAAKLNLKIMDIPVRYRERTYGTTNISRFTHGLLLFRMVGTAAKKIKFI